MIFLPIHPIMMELKKECCICVSCNISYSGSHANHKEDHMIFKV